MNLNLSNPRKGIDKAFIRDTIGGKCLLYVKYSWQVEAKAVGDYSFSSTVSAKKYYSRYYQSIKSGSERPILITVCVYEKWHL